MKQLLDRLVGPEDLASRESEDDHDAAGRREVDVIDGCLGNVHYKQQPAAKFPFKVSKSDPEEFELWVDGHNCLCTWRLAIDWTSGDRSGVTHLDHGFDKIRTITKQDFPGYFYDSQEGWVPLLPK
jgi:hypothetical protein